MAGGYQGPEQGYVQRYLPQQTAHNDAFANFLYRIVFGPTSRPGDRAPQAMAESFNPTNRAGLVNDLSMFFGGGGGHPFEAEMPGQFEPYSMAKSPVRMQEGQPHDVAELIRRTNLRASQPAAKMVHDLVFGGEVHAKGPIPNPRLPFHEIRQQAIHEREVGSMQARQSEREKTANELGSMGTDKQHALQRLFFKHGFSPHTPQGHPEFVEHVRQIIHTDRMPDQARVYAGKRVRSGTSPKENLIAGGDRVAREEALRRIMSRHNHFLN